MEGWPLGPARPEPPAGRIHIWRADLDRLKAPPAELLPAAEWERAQLIRRPGHRERWTTSRWALREILGRYLQERPNAVRIDFSERGKPRLAGAPQLRFNLSHSAGLALVALSEAGEVGVDVEAIAPRRDSARLAELALDREQAAAVRAAAPEQRDGVFYAAWTRREAIAKCTGRGLAAADAATDANADVAVAQLDAGDGYAAAVAVAGRRMPVQLRFELGPPLRG